MRLPGARMRGLRLLMRGGLVMLGGLTLAGCATRPLPVRPDQALQAAMAHPEVIAWQTAHSAPQVLAGLSPTAARGLQHLKPVAMVDLVREGLLVRLDSTMGESPRRLEVLVDRESGQVVLVRAPLGF